MKWGVEEGGGERGRRWAVALTATLANKSRCNRHDCGSFKPGEVGRTEKFEQM